MSPDLTGQVAVVIGASGRLGPVWTRALLSAGAAVAGLDVTGEVDCPQPGAEDRWLPLRADVTDRASTADALARVVAHFAMPTILVNNAGIDRPPSADGRGHLFGDIPDAESAGIVGVNALGTLLACQVVGDAMARSGQGGSVVNIGSLYASVAPDQRLYAHLPVDPPFLKPPAYGMSKAAVCALTRYLAALWGPSGVRVNTLSPGGVLGEQDETFLAKFTDRVPMRRLADPEDLSGPLLFLASAMSAYVTGHELVVDGGLLCW